MRALTGASRREQTSLTILFTDLRDSTRIYRKIGDAVMAAFRRPSSALRAILSAQQRLAFPSDGVPPFYLKAGMHHGPCIAVTMNEKLDYFGSVVNMAARLERFSSGEDVIISDTIRHDPEVAELLAVPEGRLVVQRFQARLKGFDEEQYHLWRVARSGR